MSGMKESFPRAAPARSEVGIEALAGSDCDPVRFGISDLEKEAAACPGLGARIVVSTGAYGETGEILAANQAKLPGRPESFAIARSGATIAVAGSDEVGAMYGCFELAERLRLYGAKALELKKPLVRSPYVAFRAMNTFINLPYAEKEDTSDWWFLSEDYWKDYLDQLARARINWIDIHGMTDARTGFPNAYPFFVTSDKFPDIGIPPEDAARNLAMLDKVIRMALARGIGIAFMSYDITTRYRGFRNTRNLTGQDLVDYTRECIGKMLHACPDLGMIGFRVGESGGSEDFFRLTYVPAIRECGRPVNVYTRVWVLPKRQLMEFGDTFPGRLYAEVKFTGEQYPQPYVVTGGRAVEEWNNEQWYYQDFLSHPRNYHFVWQIRQNGTNRIFPWGIPDYIARTARLCKIPGVAGFSTEEMNSLYPGRDFFHGEGSDCEWYRWGFERFWFFYDVWGRMSYDPSVPDRVWIKKFKDRYGEGVGASFFKAFVNASRIIPYACTFYAPGERSMDHRGYAPGFETGGDIARWADSLPIDTQNVQSPVEFAERIIKNEPSARLTPLQAAGILSQLSAEAMRHLHRAKAIGSDSREFRCVSKDIEALSSVGLYYAARLRSAVHFALFRLSRDRVFADSARRFHEEAVEHWNRLATIGDSHYQPFREVLRMHTNEYRWAAAGEELAGQLQPLEAAIEAGGTPMGLTPDALEPKGDKTGPVVRVKKVSVSPIVNGVKKVTAWASVDDPAGVRSVILKHKGLPSYREWQPAEMRLENGLWIGAVEARPEGLMWAIEALDTDVNGTLWPDFRRDIPYRIVNSWRSGPAKEE